MKFTSTRSTLAVDTLPAILRGLEPDGGLFVPSTAPAATGGDWSTLANAERAALGAFFDDVPETVREDAIRNLLAKFPADASSPSSPPTTPSRSSTPTASRSSSSSTAPRARSRTWPSPCCPSS